MTDNNNVPPPFPTQSPPNLTKDASIFGIVQGVPNQFSFIGSGTEYFKIWIVNLLLTIVTLGLYSPWAKVRRLRYFYGHTIVADDNFDFTGDPIKILKGRLLAVGVYLIFAVLGNFDQIIAAAGGLLIYLLMPWLLRSTYRFMARNSIYRNRRFYFFGSLSDAFITYLLCPILATLTLGILFPYFIYRHKAYQFNNLSVGEVEFSLESSVGDYYKAVLVPLLISIVLFIIMLAVISSMIMGGGFMLPGAISGALITVIYIIFLLNFLIIFWIQANVFKCTWNNLYFGNSPLATDIAIGRYVWIVFSNILLRIFTLGLASPWAAIRIHRYKVDSLSIIWQDNPDEIAAHSQQEPAAFGEEFSDILDIDVAF